MPAQINKKTAKLIIKWCQERYGNSQYSDFSKLHVTLDSTLPWHGQYFPLKNEIKLNPKKHRSTVSWCSTVIHEYTHFLQDMEKYLKYRTSYENHPYEKTANNRCERDKFEARRWLMRKLIKKKKYNNTLNK